VRVVVSKGASVQTNQEGEHPLAVETLVGQLVSLGPLRRDLLPLYHRWSNDLDVSKTGGIGWPTTFEQDGALFDLRVRSNEITYFTIYERGSLRPIGWSGLFEIEHRHSRASFAILIGEADARGKGYGTEATRLTLEYAHLGLGLSNVLLTCYEFNIAGIRAYQKAGFREFGRRRQCSRWGNKLWDLIYMESVGSDYQPLGLLTLDQSQ
jgi:RimJ/RimL family protein N-acetyltransferase